MIILDFLVYYLTCWFEKNKKKLVWSTPLQRAIYAIMLAEASLSILLEICLENTVWKDSGFKIPNLVYIFLAVGFNYLLEYIYIKRQRYERVASKRFQLDMKLGMTIALVAIIFSIGGWIFPMIFIVLPASGTAK